MWKNRAFWYCLMSGSIAGWVFVLTGAVVPFSGTAGVLWLIVCGIWAVVHPLELFISLPIGRQKGLSVGQIVIKTVLFGFTWWLPFKKGVL